MAQVTFDEAVASGVPPHIAHALTGYVNERHPIGGFLLAVLSNDLFGAYARADDEAGRTMRELVRYIYNHAPIGCHGSPKQVEAWLADR